MSNRGRPFVRLASTLHMAVALMTRAPRLNLMTHGLRQQSLKG